MRLASASVDERVSRVSWAGSVQLQETWPAQRGGRLIGLSSLMYALFDSKM